jgi:hypothetical protein
VIEPERRPAFYSARPGGWRDWWTLLHPPYTAWHLSYVVIGACLAPHVDGGRLLMTLAAFFAAVGVAAHALDELHGRPLQTRISDRMLVALAIVSLAAAAGIGVAVAIHTNLWLLAFVAAGAFIAVAYNLELFSGRLHGDPWFSLAWGSFPVLVAYFAAAERIRVEALFAAAFAGLLSHAQRRLSTPVRLVRRKARNVSGVIELTDGSAVEIRPETFTVEAERALQAIAGATCCLAVALVLIRVT